MPTTLPFPTARERRARYYRRIALVENVAVPVCMVIAGLLALGFIP